MLAMFLQKDIKTELYRIINWCRPQVQDPIRISHGYKGIMYFKRLVAPCISKERYSQGKMLEYEMLPHRPMAVSRFVDPL